MHYASEFPFSILTGIISCATDCLVLTLGCYLSGRLAALSHRIRNVDFRNGTQEFKAVIRLHQQVLRYNILSSTTCLFYEHDMCILFVVIIMFL